MSVKTLCKIFRDLHAVPQTEAIMRAQNQIEKMVSRMRPSRKHQHFSLFLGRYVDEGE